MPRGKGVRCHGYTAELEPGWFLTYCARVESGLAHPSDDGLWGHWLDGEPSRPANGDGGAGPGGYAGAPRTRRGGIPKTGNAHLRRIVIEAAWAYRHRPARGRALLTRQQRTSDEVHAIAWKAQHRLHRRYRTLTARGKSKQQVVTAVGRELVGFIWAIGTTVEAEPGRTRPVAA